MSILNLPDELLLEIVTLLFDHVPPSSSGSVSGSPATTPDPSEAENDRKQKGQPANYPYQTDGAVLLKVSRRFHRLAVPFVYSRLHINFVTPTYDSDEDYQDNDDDEEENDDGDISLPTGNANQGALLHRTLSENPSLRSYCRTLQITLPEPEADIEYYDPESQNTEPNSTVREEIVDDSESSKQTGTLPKVTSTTAIDMATEIATWLHNVKDLSINGNFIHPQTEAKTWNLVKIAGQSMPNLSKLALGKGGGEGENGEMQPPQQVWLEGIYNTLADSSMKRLRTLEVGIVVVGMGGHGVEYTHVVDPAKLLPTTSSGRLIESLSPVTSLSIDYLLAAPGNLAGFLSVFAGLEHFVFVGMPRGCFFSWPLVVLISALERHKSTLRTVRVASLRATTGDMEMGGTTGTTSLEDELDSIDLAGFTKLQGITFTAAPL